MPVALMRSGTDEIVGLAEITDIAVVPDTGDAPLTFDWQLSNFFWFGRPKPVQDAGGGPIWVRLRKEQRDLFSDLGDDFSVPAPASAGESLLDDSKPDDQRADEHAADAADESDGDGPGGPEIGSVGVVGADQPDLTGYVPGDLVASEDETSASAPEFLGDVRADDGSEVERARDRAFSYVPASAISVQEAREILTKLRDEEIKPAFPNILPQRGILRRAMLHALVEEGVSSKEEYEALIGPDHRKMTDPLHVDAYLKPILAILAKVEDSAPPARQARSGLNDRFQPAAKPPESFRYSPIHDFWRELQVTGPQTVDEFFEHLNQIGWKRPSNRALTRDVVRTDLVSMVKHGFARRIT